MPSSDRAFRALARAEPDVVVALLRVLSPRGIPKGAVITPDEVADPHLDLPPAIDADWVARVGDHRVEHVECQGYRDTTFAERLFRYHLGFVLRYRGRRVRTTALWLVRPPDGQLAQRITIGDVTVRVRSYVLADIPADALLADPKTACFAAGADPGGRTAAELCAEVVAALRKGKASWSQRHVAIVAAAMAGRYKQMVEAMDRANMEPVIIEDLVKFGFDQGFDEGAQKGAVKQQRAMLLEAIARRGFALTERQRKRIEGENSVERLHDWFWRTFEARSAAGIFSAPRGAASAGRKR